jgi:hypothetical protein
LRTEKYYEYVLDLECYNASNDVLKYIHTTEFSTENIAIPNLNKSDYIEYSLE